MTIGQKRSLSPLSGNANQVSNGLNLTLELRHPHLMPLVMGAISLCLAETEAALDQLHFVHFARFLPTRGGAALLVITEFDGDLEPYVMDFAEAIGTVFTRILWFVKDHPPLPVQDHPREFWEFIQKNNTVKIGPFPITNFHVYSAYPRKTVLDIIGPRIGLPPPAPVPASADIEFADVQGNILRGYHASLARHFALEIRDPVCAGAFLAALVAGNETACPQLTTAEDRGADRRPSYFLNLGLTASGLKKLGISDAVLARFAQAFVQGPNDAARAEANGDVDESAPRNWILGQPGMPVDLLVSLYADDQMALEEASVILRRWWPPDRLCERASYDAAALPDDRFHFGYRDGLAQPHIAGAPSPKRSPDLQPPCSAGEFLLGRNFLNVYGGSSLGDLPEAFCQNATFAAVRILEQDVEGFERVLDEASSESGLDRELIAAKLVGRWRDGTPLSIEPHAQPRRAPEGSSRRPGAARNQFDFAPSPEHPHTFDDSAGLRCPIGAHIRRMNPRSALVAGKPHSRRLIRRGMPYGPVYESGRSRGRRKGAQASTAQVARGLFGIFICADLDRQFEFLLQVWGNGDISASGIQGTQDPIIGAQNLSGCFDIPLPDDRAMARLTIPRLVTTKGSLYLFMPGIRGVRNLSILANPAAQSVVPDPLPKGQRGERTQGHRSRKARNPRFEPDRFNPKDPGFIANPYPSFAAFRRDKPVHYVEAYQSYWVFSHALVKTVCDDIGTFLKKPPGTRGARGIFFLDPPRHGEVRGIIEPLFAASMTTAASFATSTAVAAVNRIVSQDRSREFDLVTDYAKQLPRDVFMHLMGIAPDAWGSIDRSVQSVLENFDATLPLAYRLRDKVEVAALTLKIMRLWFNADARATERELIGLMKREGEAAGMSWPEVWLSAVDFALGGYLSTEFLIATGTYHLLRDGGESMRLLKKSPRLLDHAIAEMLRFDAPFQLADRYAARRTTLGGVTIPKGAMVTVVFASANRDETVFAEPDRFDIRRPPGPHFGFGHGIHHCIGAPLVKIVAPIAFATLLSMLPELSLDGDEPQWQSDPYFRTFPNLRLRF